ncbi:uncharacterized protein LOC129939961 [Eupeodes corollae]|uniref:uncharacterized protein LOC129939961 n=1 Tax=Eupeodes corollae TaxID=290404 RepID=UPI002492E125|nr:uncharacterized protein LOC129939961 [Eupeodes corollae]
MNKNNNNERRFWTEFLEIYKNLPALWCIRSSDYSNRGLKAEAYEILVNKLREIDPNADRDCVVRKINNFRSSYRRDMNKKRKREESEGKDCFVSSLWYFDLLHFLHDQKDAFEDLPSSTMSTSTSVMNENENYNQEGSFQHYPKGRSSKRKWSVKEEQQEEEQETEAEDLPPEVIWNYFKESNNDAAILAKAWETQYSELSSQQKVFVRKLFSDVLFTGCLGKLNEQVVVSVHRLLESTCASEILPTSDP